MERNKHCFHDRVRLSNRNELFFLKKMAILIKTECGRCSVQNANRIAVDPEGKRETNGRARPFFEAGGRIEMGTLEMVPTLQ